MELIGKKVTRPGDQHRWDYPDIEGAGLRGVVDGANLYALSDQEAQGLQLFRALCEGYTLEELQRMSLTFKGQIDVLRVGYRGALSDVAAERRRQIEAEGGTPAHDDKHNGGCQLAAAAATYALCVTPEQLKVRGVTAWPWPRHWWKPTTYRRNLVKAGALIIAEIERIDRAAAQGVRHDPVR